MPTTVSNLALGPGDLYSGLFGVVVEPPNADVNITPPTSGGWASAGGTQDGITLTINKEFTELAVDQIIDVPGRRTTKRDVRLVTNLAEVTLENLKVAENGGTIATGTGWRTYDPVSDTSATQPTYQHYILDAWGVNSKRRRVFGRKALSIANPELAYKKDGQTLIPVEFACHYVDDTTKPYKVLDSTT